MSFKVPKTFLILLSSTIGNLGLLLSNSLAGKYVFSRSQSQIEFVSHLWVHLHNLKLFLKLKNDLLRLRSLFLRRF